ncbi:MAG TPA: amino acid adenylation domain-containing protein, partial [Herpetosiphonaceae bacterium]
MQSATTLVDLLRQRAWQQPDQRAYTFLKDGETDAIHLTYAQLDRQARAIAVQLQAMVQPGDRVLLLYPPGLEYIAAFFGCLYTGAIAVPAYPPSSSRLERVLPRLQAMIANAQPAAALTTTPILTMMAPGVTQEPAFQQLQWLATDGLDQQQAQVWAAPQVDAASIAFLQYTSGSTALPKGVMVSHGNLLHNQRLIQSAFDHSEQTIVAGWLPLYHDMGLIGNVLQPLYLGTSCVLMSPVAFLQSPIRWLQAISRYGATTSGGPNFAYELCVQKTTIEQRQTLDLSSWRVAFNGAEPVRHDTLAAFTTAFEPYGFRAEAFYPCYGLAESTLFVSGGAASARPTIQAVQKSALAGDRAIPAVDETDALSLVSAGAPRFDQSLAIVDPQTGIAREDGHVGEIWVAGPSVAHGYWNRPEESAATFAARLADTGAGPFLRTGDLGFVRDGELFVTGRLKDLIIIRGRNHYPQDIELTVERSHYALRPGCGAAFSVTVDGEERLVVVQEVERQHRKIDPAPAIQAIRAAVAEQHELQVYGVVLIKPGSLPKTSSGKIQRRACQAKFGAGELEVYGSSLLDAAAATAGEATLSRADLMACPANERPALVERYLKQQIARVLRIASSEIAPAQSINALGLDSLMAIELQHSVEADLQIVLPMVSFLRDLHIAELAAELLDQLSRQEAGPQRAQSAGADQPLSPGQRALWFLHQLAPESAASNLANAVRIRSAVDAAALERAFQKLIDRHAALRSVIVAPEGEPIQRVLDQAAVSFQAQDASGWSESALETFLTAETQRPFDLATGPLLRVYLLGRSAQEQILVLVLHHIIADLWSLAVLLQELGTLYSAERNQADAALTPLALQYADYVRWQAEDLAGERGQRLWAYWQQQLGGELPVLQLPTDRPRPPVQTYRGEARSFTLDAALTQQIKQLAQDRGTTLYTLLLTAFQVLLHRYSGQHDILVGSPTAGRTRSQFANVVGYFVNPVVLRADLAGNPAFTALLEQSRQTVLAAFEHQEYPFAWLVERLQAERDPGRSPLFQAMFILQKVQQQQAADVTALALGDPGAQVQLGELVLESLPPTQQTAQFDIALSLAESERGLSGSLQGNADLFDAATLARMAEHFQHLLGAIASNPTQPIAQLELMSQHERALTLHQWNANATAYPSHALLHSLVEAQAARTPESIAVVGETATLTYRELDRRANQLAHRLQQLGVTAETPVGLCLGRTPDLIVGALAILKAGGCYVPLDPAYPQERLALILEDAQVRVLVTQTALRSYLPDLDIPVIDLGQADQLDSQPEHAPSSMVAADNLAYLIYTSGSTGRPKGVAISHRSAAAFIHWSLDTFTSDDLAGVLAATSICFDLSIFEIFAPLSSGGSAILAENVLQLPELPAAQRVTLINTVPSAMSELLHLAAIPQSVRVINLAGEALRQDLVQQTQAAAPHCRVFNLYGPSEDTTYSTFALVEPQDATPPIGRPISNTQAYILDAWLQPAPIGVAGELYLAGAGLARGYLQRPELTAEKFLPNPFDDTPGARFYKTGDLVRYRADGQLEYLGRIDQQVKLRGFRIELGEIEATLREYPEVREAVVVVNEDARAGKRLVAYVTGEQKNKGPKEQGKYHHSPSPVATGEGVARSAGDEGLRAFLQSRLPEYMIPAAFVALHQLPRTPSGKLDRRALPAPHFGDQAADAYVAPRTPIETTLAALWAEVLNLEQVGIHDNFFALGGHSLIAARLMHRVRETFQQDLPLHSLFELPTVAGLAQRIAAMQQTEQSSAPAIRPASRTTELPLSFAQQRYWFLDQLIPGSAVYNTPSALRLRGALDVAALERSLSTILERHAALRTTFDVVDGQPVQNIDDVSPLALPVLDLSAWTETEREHEAQRRLVEQAQQPFDLTRAPLLRAELLRLAGDEHILLLVTHHIAFDGTHNIFYRELSELYRAFTQGATPELPELPVSYADFAVWQREYVAGEVLDTQISYWTEQLGCDLTPLQLPTDRPRPSVQTFNGARQAIAFPPELVTALRALSRQANTTLYTTALAAFQLLLHRYSGQDAISVGTPVVNHGRAEAQPLIGSFVNTLVLRSNLAGNPTFGELLAQVQRIAQEGYAHGDLPFEMIVEALQPERDLSRNPLFQVMFVLQPDPLQHLDLAHLTTSAVEIDTSTARFDLLLSLWEGEQSLTGMIEYNTDLFDAGTITRLLSHFQTILESVGANPDLRVRDVPLIPAAERRQMLYDWNATDAGYERDACLHTLFERQAARTPDAIAIAFEAGTRERVQVRYAELNAQANQLARQLQALGIGAGEVVAVYMERSPEMIAAVLGILKAGATYV